MTTLIRPTLMGLPAGDIDRLHGVTVAVLGASEATSYGKGEASHSATAPAAIRTASASFARQLRQHDFDLGTTLFPESDDWRGVVDLGDVATDTKDFAGNRDRIGSAVRTLLRAGVVPIVLGGDDSVPIPVLAAYQALGRPVAVVQVDAHVDWGDTIKGEPNGYGSPMRRASEMAHVTHMTQIGIRGLGSGEAWQHDDARAWGSRLVTSYELHEHGMAAALAEVPAGSDIVVCIDCDGLDPAIFPAVAMPTPGGLTYEDIVRLLRGVAGRGRLAGLILAEFVPEADNAQRGSALIAARLAAIAVGLALG